MKAYIRAFRTPLPLKAITMVKRFTSFDSGHAVGAMGQLVVVEKCHIWKRSKCSEMVHKTTSTMTLGS